MRRAARVSTGSQVTCGSGSRMFSKSSLEKVRLAGGRQSRQSCRQDFRSGNQPLDPLLDAERKVERDGAVNCHFGRNLLEQRGIGAHGRCVARGQHIEPDSFSGEVARQACGAQHPDASGGRKE